MPCKRSNKRSRKSNVRKNNINKPTIDEQQKKVTEQLIQTRKNVRDKLNLLKSTRDSAAASLEESYLPLLNKLSASSSTATVTNARQQSVKQEVKKEETDCSAK